ncbi:MAG: amidohydrolase family protein [Melioribacteraceae bacterium]|nr:amidohydrolase family protein [Melioribacteraceae bacterium]
MKKYFIIPIHVIILLVLISCYNFAQIAVKGDIVYTMAGEAIKDGIVLIENNKIEKVGTQSEVAIPDGYKIIEGAVVTPGLIDAHTVVGLSGIYNQKHDQDQIEYSNPIQPELRALDAFNPNEVLIKWLAGFGVTTVNTGHAPGALSSGQTMIVKTNSKIGDSILDSVFAVVFSLGSEVSSKFKNPKTRPKGIAMLRSAFFNAQNYMKKMSKGEGEFNLKNEILSEILNKNVKAIFTANSSIDILGAIRLADEFNFDLILDGAAEAYLVLNEIKKADVPVILHPMMARTNNISYETPMILKDKGILFAIQGGYESYVPKVRNILFEAAIAAANGLTFNEALASITIDAAEILGIDNRIGSIEVGKDADIAVFDGDPFEYTTHTCEVIINGEVIKTECK